MKDRGSPGSVELIGGRLEVVGGRVDEPDRPTRRLEELDAVGVLVGEDLDDRALGIGREAADLAPQSQTVLNRSQSRSSSVGHVGGRFRSSRLVA